MVKRVTSVTASSQLCKQICTCMQFVRFISYTYTLYYVTTFFSGIRKSIKGYKKSNFCCQLLQHSCHSTSVWPKYHTRYIRLLRLILQKWKLLWIAVCGAHVYPYTAQLCSKIFPLTWALFFSNDDLMQEMKARHAVQFQNNCLL